MSDQTFFMSKDFFSERGGVTLSPGMLYASVGIGVALTTSVVFMLACCVIRRKKQRTDKTMVKEGYSMAVDSVSIHQYERYHYAEYSIPEDAISSTTRAQQRVSIADGNYDTLTRNFKRSLANTGHVYSHVTLPRTENKRKSSSGSESHYDVTPYSKMKKASSIVTVSSDDSFGDIYGHVTINPMHNIQNV